jgi:hypothetical protein
MPQPQHDLRPSERPTRSDFARSEFTLEKAYARRRLATIGVIALVLGAVGYGMLGHRTSDPADIPTIAGVANVKQKPANPGGIDIPHQDVQVYDELEGKSAQRPQIEHLLPPPEVPREIPHAAITTENIPQPQEAPLSAAIHEPSPSDILPSAATRAPIATTVAPAPVPVVAPVPASAPSVAVTSAMPAPAAAPVLATTATQILPTSIPPAVKKIAPAAPKPNATAAPQSLTIEQLIKDNSVPTVPPSVASSPSEPTEVASVAPQAAPTPSVPRAATTGSFVIQLASTTNQSRAQAMIQDLQQKYVSQLGSAILRVVPADLGSRGIYYRIQSQGLSEDSANQICSSLKQISAGCILVRK